MTDLVLLVIAICMVIYGAWLLGGGDGGGKA